MALGMDGEEILSTFYNAVTYSRDGENWRIPYSVDRFKGMKIIGDMLDADTGEVVAESGRKLTARAAKQIAEKGVKAIRATDDDLLGSYLAEDIVNYATGEIYLEAGDEIDEKTLKVLLETGGNEINILDIDHVNVGAYIRNTLAADKNQSRQDALFDIYRVMRPALRSVGRWSC
uniref:DNA-directed RNA polymerase n=1 Tax=Panagrolaimus superbus TaxID=310955 RepID=A0A914XSS4_9BILA